MEIFLFFSVLGWLIACMALGGLGSNREIGKAKAFFISLLLSPLIGAIFVATSPTKTKINGTADELTSSTSQQLFEGDLDISSPSYQLFLTRQFAIEKNATLEKFIIGNDVFNTLEESLREADSRYQSRLSELKRLRDSFKPESLHDAAMNSHWTKVSRLLKEGADVNQINAEGKTALDIARTRRDRQIIRILIENGATERQV